MVGELLWYNFSSVCGLSAWWLYSGANGDLLQESLCHMLCDPGLLHPEPLPLLRPLLTRTSTGDTQTLKGRSGSVSVGSLGPGVHKDLFEASEHLWQVWGLILNADLYSKLGQSLYMDEAKINEPSSKFAAQVYITWVVQLIPSHETYLRWVEPPCTW